MRDMTNDAMPLTDGAMELTDGDLRQLVKFPQVESDDPDSNVHFWNVPDLPVTFTVEAMATELLAARAALRAHQDEEATGAWAMDGGSSGGGPGDGRRRDGGLMTKTNPHGVVTMTPILGGLTIEPMLYRMEDGTPRRLHRRRRTDWRWRVWQWRGTSPENFAVQTVTEVVDTLRSHGFDLTEADLTQTFTLTLNVTRTAPR